MAEERILDAKALLDGGRWAFAYYAAGYAVECGLKSCVLARMIHTAWVFQEKWKAQDCLTHDFNELINLAGLMAELNAQLKAGGDFVTHWGTAVKWKVDDRYRAPTEMERRWKHDLFTPPLPTPRMEYFRGFEITGRRDY